MDEPTLYRITVEGTVSEPFAKRLGMLATSSIAADRSTTILTGTMVDQAALLGVLTVLYDMGYQLVGVEYSPQDL